MGIGLAMITLGACRVSASNQTNNAIMSAGFVLCLVDIAAAVLLAAATGSAAAFTEWFGR